VITLGRAGERPAGNTSPGRKQRLVRGFADNGFREPCRAPSRANEIPSRTRKGVCGASEVGVGRGEGEGLGPFYACIVGR
jgi:hypothetical protein